MLGCIFRSGVEICMPRCIFKSCVEIIMLRHEMCPDLSPACEILEYLSVSFRTSYAALTPTRLLKRSDCMEVCKPRTNTALQETWLKAMRLKEVFDFHDFFKRNKSEKMGQRLNHLYPWSNIFSLLLFLILRSV